MTRSSVRVPGPAPRVEVQILIRFIRTVRSSWEELEFRGLCWLVVVTLICGTLFYWNV